MRVFVTMISYVLLCFLLWLLLFIYWNCLRGCGCLFKSIPFRIWCMSKGLPSIQVSNQRDFTSPLLASILFKYLVKSPHFFVWVVMNMWLDCHFILEFHLYGASNRLMKSGHDLWICDLFKLLKKISYYFHWLSLYLYRVFIYRHYISNYIVLR